jgi:hypothetical protein
MQRPPPVLDCAWVLEYAEVDESVRYTGKSTLYVGGKELGAVPRLALCQNLDEAEVMIFHCDREWNVLGTGSAPSLSAARESAERAYSGISAKWIKSRYSREEAEKYLSESWAEERCSFCGRMPHQVSSLVHGQTGAKICNLCVSELWLSEHGDG